MKATKARKITRKQIRHVLAEWDLAMANDAIAAATRKTRVGAHAGVPSPKTGKLAGYLGKLAEITKGTDICDLVPEDIEEYFAGCADKRLAGKSGSYNAHLGALKAFMEFAVIRGYILPEDAAALVGTRRREKDEGEELYKISLDDIDRLIEYAGMRHPRNRFVLVMGIETAYRENEVKAATLGSLDFAAEETKVWRSKPRNWHAIPWTPEFAAELARWLAHYAEQAEYADFHAMIADHPEWPLVPAMERGGANRIIPGVVTKTSLKWVVKLALKDAKLTPPQGDGWIGLHTLRRSLLDAIDERGGRTEESLRQAQLVAGHQSALTTRRYLKRDRDRAALREIMAGGIRHRQPAGEEAEVIPLDALAARRAARQADSR